MNKLCFLKDRLRFSHLPLVRWPHSRYSEGFVPKKKTSKLPYHEYRNQEALEFKIIFGVLTSPVHLEHPLSVNDIYKKKETFFNLMVLAHLDCLGKTVGLNWQSDSSSYSHWQPCQDAPSCYWNFGPDPPCKASLSDRRTPTAGTPWCQELCQERSGRPPTQLLDKLLNIMGIIWRRSLENWTAKTW